MTERWRRWGQYCCGGGLGECGEKKVMGRKQICDLYHKALGMMRECGEVMAKYDKAEEVENRSYERD